MKIDYAQFKLDNTKWRVDMEDMNSKKFQEIHEAVKIVNNQMGKGSDDWQDRSELLSAETKLLENAL